jgi:hypothetical protein
MALFPTALGLYGGVLWSGELQGFIAHEMVPAATGAAAWGQPPAAGSRHRKGGPPYARGLVGRRELVGRRPVVGGRMGGRQPPGSAREQAPRGLLATSCCAPFCFLRLGGREAGSHPGAFWNLEPPRKQRGREVLRL